MCTFKKHVYFRMFSICEVCFYDGNEMDAKNFLQKMNSLVKHTTTKEERIKYDYHETYKLYTNVSVNNPKNNSYNYLIKYYSS